MSLNRKRKIEEESGNGGNDVVADYFSQFIKKSLDDAERGHLKQSKRIREIGKIDLDGVGNAVFYSGAETQFLNKNSLNHEMLGWNNGLTRNFEALQGVLAGETQTFFNIMNQYIDLLAYPQTKDYRNVYIAHIVDHLVKTRNLIIHNKKKLQLNQEKDMITDELIETTRDQGFARPTVLILCPFKKDAYDIVDRLKILIFGDSKQNVMKASRFETEFSNPTEAPEFDDEVDQETKELLTGNNDDCFRIGITLSKKTLKLYEPFDRADIILCSPLGLRMILEKEDAEAYLISSINITVLDSADIIQQQNWQNITLIFEKLLQQPPKINTDITRVRQYFLDGDSKHFHQLIAFSRYPVEILLALMYKESMNHRGLVVAQPLQEGALNQILIPLCQELHRFDVKTTEDQSDARFKYFTSQILSTMKPRTCLVIPSYFDFVRVRNHMKRMEESFVACHEYADKAKIKRAKDMFIHERKSYLLVTERFYYFNRKRIRGIDQIVFYQLPSHPNFYSAFINMAKDQNGARFKAVLLYTKIDRIRLENTFGTKMAIGVLKSDKNIQVIVSE